MIDFYLELAGKKINVFCNYDKTKEYCRKFIISTITCPDITISVSNDDIESERKMYGYATNEDLEINALHRKICEAMVQFNTILIHGSAVAFENCGYIFIAPSGTGKSTHSEKWARLFGAVYINDDKPLVRVDDVPTIYGTPWMGKHSKGENISAIAKGICVLCRGEENSISLLSKDEGFMELLKQTYMPKSKELSERTVFLAKKLSSDVPIYKMFCNINDSAALTSFSKMTNASL